MIEAVENHMPETVIVVSTADLSCSPGAAFDGSCLAEQLSAIVQVFVSSVIPFNSARPRSCIVCRMR